MTVEIPLTRGFVALVDDGDAARVMPYRWIALKGPRTWYAWAQIPSRGRSGAILMHSLLTGWPRVDHANGDGLDNRRQNLRQATQQQNMRNSRKYRGGSSRYKGVCWKIRNQRWLAQIYVSEQDASGVPTKRKLHLGTFTDQETAARAYDAAAREHFGEFACLNFPLPGERGALGPGKGANWRKGD